jgi:hypothetical protein
MYHKVFNFNLKFLMKRGISMKKIIFLTFVVASALAFAGCDTIRETNSNKAVVVNNNANIMNANVMNANTNRTTDRVDYNANITREEYDKDKDRYTSDAERTGSTIGSGINDGWLWTKTKTALATTNDLRDSTIDVDVENAVVTLRGTVATKQQQQQAIKVANEIDGVTKVNNMLKVAPADSMTNMSSDNNRNANMKK